MVAPILSVNKTTISVQDYVITPGSSLTQTDDPVSMTVTMEATPQNFFVPTEVHLIARQISLSYICTILRISLYNSNVSWPLYQCKSSTLNACLYLLAHDALPDLL